MEKLFIYGTLAPGRPNEHKLRDIDGIWEEAIVKGILHQEGWGADMGYPGIILNETLFLSGMPSGNRTYTSDPRPHGLHRPSAARRYPL